MAKGQWLTDFCVIFTHPNLEWKWFTLTNLNLFQAGGSTINITSSCLRVCHYDLPNLANKAHKLTVNPTSAKVSTCFLVAALDETTSLFALELNPFCSFVLFLKDPFSSEPYYIVLGGVYQSTSVRHSSTTFCHSDQPQPLLSFPCLLAELFAYPTNLLAPSPPFSIAGCFNPSETHARQNGSFS